ncbi:MAG TPA: hypothetical protein VKA70_06085 [Blastocatellia bacterium]|nr:hypothetical protein [Blastocatellia bacterium]
MRKHHPPPGRRVPSQVLSRPGAQRAGASMLLVAIQEEFQPPSGQGEPVARRMKILRIEQTSMLAEKDAASLYNGGRRRGRLAAPQAEPRSLLPEAPTGAQEIECWIDGKRAGLRSVGEVVTDEAGNFYEVQGRELRRLGELVRDEGGRVFEVCPATGEQSNKKAPDPEPQAAQTEVRQQDTIREEAHQAESRPQSEESPGYRKILEDPGIYLKLPFSKIGRELAPQLKHPGRLTDEVIECYAQVYEAQRTMAVDRMAAAELGDSGLHTQFHPLTRDKAQMLNVPELFKPTRYPFETRASTRQLYPGQRVYRLWPVFDPTASRDRKPTARDKAPAKESAAAARDRIPQEYLSKAQYKYSREEVIYDMKRMLGTLPPEAGLLACWLLIYPARLLKLLGTSVLIRGRMKKWRAMIRGKAPDQQLWAVTPPRGFSYNTAVRRWAEETLGEAGYDARRMLVEWEIFWRRKGWI